MASQWLEAQANWYYRNVRSFRYEMSKEDIKLLEDIVSGRRLGRDLPENLRVQPSGIHFDYDRACAAEILLIKSLEDAVGPVIDWVKKLGSDEGERHWTTCSSALNCFSEITYYEKYLQRCKEAIPALREIAMDLDPKGKGVPSYAITLISKLGGEEAEEALKFIKDNASYKYSKWCAYRDLRDNFGYPNEEIWIRVRNGEIPQHKDGYGPMDEIGDSFL